MFKLPHYSLKDDHIVLIVDSETSLSVIIEYDLRLSHTNLFVHLSFCIYAAIFISENACVKVLCNLTLTLVQLRKFQIHVLVLRFVHTNVTMLRLMKCTLST